MHVVVNAAMSADGKLSTRRREQIAISGSEDFARVDRLRADNDAVMVGVGTVLADDPHLDLDDEENVMRRRQAGQSPHPTRVIADSTARTPPEARILDDVAETVVLVASAAPKKRIEQLQEQGATVIVAGDDRVDLAAAFEQLEVQGIESIMVEGGGELIFSLFEAALVDELSVFVGNVVFGGAEAPTLADGEGFVDDFPSLSLTAVEQIDNGVLLRWDVA